MAQMIHQVFDPIQLKPRTVEGKQQNCYLSLFLRNKMERKVANPVQYISPHFVQTKAEHEIHGFKVRNLWQKDNSVFSFEFYISKEMGIFHMYVGGK